MQGVKISVKSVANARPPATADASCAHQSVDGPPAEMSREKKLMLIFSTMGIKPRIVVIVVRRTGLRRCAPVLKTASEAGKRSTSSCRSSRPCSLRMSVKRVVGMEMIRIVRLGDVLLSANILLVFQLYHKRLRFVNNNVTKKSHLHESLFFLTGKRRNSMVDVVYPTVLKA